MTDHEYLVVAHEPPAVSNRPPRLDVSDSLVEWRHHLVALIIVAAAFGVASVFASKVAYYAAALLAFSVWMGWFVLTVVEYLRNVDF